MYMFIPFFPSKHPIPIEYDGELVSSVWLIQVHTMRRHTMHEGERECVCVSRPVKISFRLLFCLCFMLFVCVCVLGVGMSESSFVSRNFEVIRLEGSVQQGDPRSPNREGCVSIKDRDTHTSLPLYWMGEPSFWVFLFLLLHFLARSLSLSLSLFADSLFLAQLPRSPKFSGGSFRAPSSFTHSHSLVTLS